MELCYKYNTIIPKIKVGMTVRIRRDLEVLSYYGREGTCHEMMAYCGKVGVVTRVVGKSLFKIDLDGGMWRWTPQMMEEIWEDQPSSTTT